jgi:hypothetical protein
MVNLRWREPSLNLRRPGPHDAYWNPYAAVCLQGFVKPRNLWRGVREPSQKGWKAQPVLVPLGAEWWAEPIEQPADRDTIATYDVDPQALTRWREARNAYLAARAALVGQVERRGWRALARAPATSHVDIVFDGPPGPDAPRFVEVEDEWGRSIRYGEWIERDDGAWALRIPSADSSG